MSLGALKGSQHEFQKKGLFSPRSFEQSGLLPEAIPAPFGATPAMVGQASSMSGQYYNLYDIFPTHLLEIN